MLTVLWDYRRIIHQESKVQEWTPRLMRKPWKQAEKMNKLHLLGGKKLTLLWHDNAKPHTSVISAAIETVSFEVVPHPLYSSDLEPSVFCWFGAFKKHLKAVFLLTMKNFKLLWPRCFNNSQKNSALTGSTDLFSAGGIVLNERRTRWKQRYRNKVHILSCILRFHIDTLSGCKGTNMDALLLEQPLYIVYYV